MTSIDHYPIIEFKPIIAPMLPTKSTRGRLVGDYLVVSYAETLTDGIRPSYAIYNTRGRRLFQAAYTDAQGAIEMAEWLNKVFGEFFPIWEEYPDADVFGLARWSVDDGIRIYDKLKQDHNLR